MASGNDMKAANETYAGFVSLVKWATPLTMLITAIVVVVIQ